MITSEKEINNYIKELINYCENFEAWPKINCMDLAPNGTKTSNDLALWLEETKIEEEKYNNCSIKYNGKKVLELLKELYRRYNDEIRAFTKEDVISNVRYGKINYCSLNEKLKSDKRIIISALEYDLNNLKYVDEEIQNDIDILLAVKRIVINNMQKSYEYKKI